MEKTCHNCKQKLTIDHFTLNSKVFSKCNICRNNINKKYKKNTCLVCGINAVFNYECESKGEYCKEHALPDMIDVKSKKCKHEGCKKIPVFNYEGESKGEYCKEHALPGMIDVKSKKCKHEGCNKQPVFNYEGEDKREYCKEHALPGMIDVKNKRCKHEGCKKIPSFNYEGEDKGKYCKEHALPGMIDVKHKKCKHQACKKRPSFNYEGEDKGEYCKEHALPGMIDVKNKRCKNQGCNKQPNFNYEGEDKGEYCKDHALPGMIDVKHKKCTHCKTSASYGYCCQDVSRCAKHKEEKMIVRPKRKCIGNDEEDCKELSMYGITEPIHCLNHSLQNEVCFIGQKCKKCYREDEILNKEGICINFCSISDEYNKVKKYEKKKEKLVLDYLDKNLVNNKIKNIVDDRIVDSYCNMYRPDRIYDCLTHYVIVEIDENQHKGYNWEKCSLNLSLEHAEKKRMHEIQNACGMNCIFLRFNPDNYYTNGIKGNINMRERLKLLVKWVEKCIDMFPKKDIEAVKYKYLFYDNYNQADLKFLEIDDLELV